MNTALNHIPDFVASDATDEFNEDPVYCIEQMIAADNDHRIKRIQSDWISGQISTIKYNQIVAQERSQTLERALKEIVSGSWQSNDVRETSQSVRDQWLDKWVAFQGGRS